MVTIAVVIGLCIPTILEIVEDLGQNIPQADLESDYIIGISWAIILGGSILLWPISSKNKRDLLCVWAIKAFVVLGFMLIYESRYDSLDGYSYFDTPRRAGFLWEGLTVRDGTSNIMSLVWLHQRVLPDSYHTLKLSFAMIGLVAIYIFYRAAVIFLQREDRRVFYILALFPSILFWSSILGKEPIALFGIALYVYAVVAWYQFKKFRYLWLLLLGILVAMFVRIWLAPILLAPLVIFIFRGIRRVIPRVAFMIFVVLAFFLSMGELTDHFSLETPQDVLATVDGVSRSWAYGGSAQDVNYDFTNPSQMVSFVPLGIFTALFRPLPAEVLNLFGLLAGIENAFLLILLLLALKRMRWRELRKPLVMWALALVLIWATVYGFVSYQNLGAAVRFKLQILPVLLGLLLYLSRRTPNKLVSKQRTSMTIAQREI